MLRKQPSEQERAAFQRLKLSVDGELIKRLLQQNLIAADEANRQLEGVNLNRSQGSALTLKAILDLLN